MHPIPESSSDDEAPRDEPGRFWFLRSCVGLAFALWAVALTQPLADFTDGGWKFVRTREVYPFGEVRAPIQAVVLVGGTLPAVVVAGTVLGMHSSRGEYTRAYGGVLAFLLTLWCSYCVAILVRSFDAGTPLAGLWMIVLANLLLGVAVLISESWYGWRESESSKS
ncbi:hypothetical protein [Nocardia vulneris]|uniref:Uncharacterized protein n=1 Tax=Nocardia vulneris TaxID=1141657 RepID=A0ABR4ZKN4_9NOCA|nr:hypothetical protein [Nocardia vulneris]KIA65976.1 hypothetical protein FG87_05895 [Nocardia vulneris]